MTSLYCTDSVLSGETAIYYDVEVNSELDFQEMLTLSKKGVSNFDSEKSGYYYLYKDKFIKCLNADIEDDRFSSIPLGNFIFKLRHEKSTNLVDYAMDYAKKVCNTDYKVTFIAEKPKEDTTKRCYISGQISGIEDIAESIFESAEEVVCKLGYIPINPMKIEHNHDKSSEKYMRVGIIELMRCDAIYVLRNWRNSNEATIEVNLAKDLGINIIFQK
jgi:hypothetical protein